MNPSFLEEIKRNLISLFVIIIGVVASVGALVLAIDIHCSNDTNYWMPVYPDAQLIETEQSGYFRVRGMGITEQTYFTPDAENIIRTWYRDYRRQITAGQFNSSNPNSAMTGFADANWFISPAEDGTGSIIRYHSQCAY